MNQIERMRRLGLFDARLPRYTSYPTAPHFTAETGGDFHRHCLSRVAPDSEVSVYLHIPFCERLCWFCACHTRGTKTLAPVEAYVEMLERELAWAARLLPAGVRMGRLHWGGGTPTILSPALIRRLAAAVREAIPPAANFEFSVEIDPTLVDDAKIAALAAEGMCRASIGVQDFHPQVQAAIGREQSFDTTRECVAALRAAGIRSLNVDLVYGLPHQTRGRLAETLRQVLSLAPDRIALFGYAHVPWMAKRQRLIDEAALPGDEARWALAETAAALFSDAGYRRLGIDHFALPGDSLSRAAERGGLRRNFQGYTDDRCQALMGFGASAISRFADGYVQNAPATAAWHQRVAADLSAAVRGHRFSEEDRLRGRAIEMLMCDLRLDMDELRAAFGPAADRLLPLQARVIARFSDVVDPTASGFVIRPEGRALTRLVAAAFDARLGAGGRFSQAS